MEVQDLAVYEGNSDQSRQVNRSESCSDDPTVHFSHIFSEAFNILSGLVREPRVLKGLDKHVNDIRVDLLLILDDSEKYLRTRGFLTKKIYSPRA